MDFRLTGLVAATFTPMHDDGSLNLDRVGPIVEHLIERQLAALYVCGSTGEGPLLTVEEREATAAAFVQAAAGRLPVVVQVGHSSVAEARRLAAHAQQIGADAVSAVAPYYFKPTSVDVLLSCLAEMTAGAPALPFYYYHIPAITGVALDPVELFNRAADRLPTLAGIKYTAPTLDEFQTLQSAAGGRYDVLHGRDEMLLAGLATGARGAVGSTYNFAAPLYHALIEAFDGGDVERARSLQATAVSMIRAILHHGQAGLKAAMGLFGPDCGPVRLPLVSLGRPAIEQLRADLEAIGVFEWMPPRDAA